MQGGTAGAGDEKIARRMAELTERTPVRAPRPAARTSPPPEPEAVLPGLKAEKADKVAVEDEEEEGEKKEPPAPQKLRLSVSVPPAAVCCGLPSATT